MATLYRYAKACNATSLEGCPLRILPVIACHTVCEEAAALGAHGRVTNRPAVSTAIMSRRATRTTSPWLRRAATVLDIGRGGGGGGGGSTRRDVSGWASPAVLRARAQRPLRRPSVRTIPAHA